jgi:SAM-dependent methyltransferase
MITAGQERDFYDQQYGQFLALPDHALRIDRKVLEGNIANPAHPFYERRLLYRATMQALEGLAGEHVLDYGCGPADFGIWMATEGAHVTLLDLSPAAIELGQRRARASGVKVRGVAADASRLDMFRDGEFDVVFACAALHHTMKYPGAVEELGRVMRPGGRLVLCETWGANPVLNVARRLRAIAGRQQQEQGEELILSPIELKKFEPFFDRIEVRPLNFLAMAKRVLRDRFDRASARAVLRGLEGVDRVLLDALPALRNYCGEAVITARRSVPLA